MLIRGIVFDYGGVLARSPVLTDFLPVADEIGLTWEMYRDGFSKYRLAYDGDMMACADMYRRIAADHGLTLNESQCERLCLADDESWLHPLPETLPWMKELKTEGYQIGILTNMATSFFDRCVSKAFAEHIGLADAIVVSGKVGVTKPDPRIYRIFEDRIGLRPGELFFLDDNVCNVRGAEAAGWNAAAFESVSCAKDALRRCCENRPVNQIHEQERHYARRH